MKNVSLLPDNVQIHIASYVSSEAEAVLIFAPDEADNCLEEGEPLSLTIDYPLSKEVTFTVPFSYCVNEMIDVICDKYREIYEKEERGFDKTDGKRAGKKETGNYKRKNQH